MKQVDARGDACPIPVIKTKKALQEENAGQIEVLVDNEIAVQNLGKMAVQMGLDHNWEKVDAGTYRVVIDKKGTGADPVLAEEKEIQVTCKPMLTTVVALTSDKMGTGDDALGKMLMKSFVYALTQLEQAPDTVLLYNGGAKLSTEGSDSIEDLEKLQQRGSEILTCGTCLNHFGLTEKLKVGGVTNMYEIAEKMAMAGSVIRP